MLDLTRKLCSLPGVSSREEAVREFIAQTIRPYVKWMKVDAMGNLIAFKEGKKHTGSKLLLDAHMDEVGVVVKGIEDDGCLRFAFLGGVDRRVVIGKRVWLGKNRVPGVIGMKPIHLTTAEERKALPKLKDLYIDIGAKSKDEALSECPPGTFAYYDNDYQEFGDGFAVSKALDDRVGCAMLMQLLANDYECDFYGVFTVQEEVGLRGMYAAAYSVAPDVVIVLEGTTANDMPEVKNVGFVTKMSHGPAISFMDNATIVSPDMFKALTETANAAGIKWQPRQGTTGANDQGPAQRMRAGCKTGCISVPCRYIHSPASIADIDDIMGAYALADAFLKNKKFNEVL